MLSFLFKLANDFEHSHGHQPNILYINQHHFDILRKQLTEIEGLDKLSKFLGMDIVFSNEATNPHVGWRAIEWKKASA